MAQRIKGTDVEISIVVDGVVQANITAVRSFEVTFETDIMSEGYLGETTERKDTIFKGVSGKLELHLETQDILKLFGKIINSARVRTAGTKINIKATLRFPNGQNPKLSLNNCEFGSLPLNFSSRSDYATTSLDFACPDYTLLF